MGRCKSILVGTILSVTALVLAACTSHHVRHPAYREAAPAHHHRTVVHPPARHRTVIVRPPARHRTVIVHPPARHRSVVVHPSKRHKRHIRKYREHHEARRDAKNRHRKDHRAAHREREVHPRGKAPVEYRQPRGIGVMRDPHQVRRSRPIEGHISGGRPDRPDVVMPKTKPRDKQPSRSLKGERQKAGNREDRRRSNNGDSDRRERGKDD